MRDGEIAQCDMAARAPFRLASVTVAVDGRSPLRPGYGSRDRVAAGRTGVAVWLVSHSGSEVGINARESPRNA